MQQALLTWICGFSVSLLRRSSQTLSGWMGTVCEQPLSPLSRNDEFKSGLWLSLSRMLTELSLSHCCVVLAVCLGPLSSWKVVRSGFQSGYFCNLLCLPCLYPGQSLFACFPHLHRVYGADHQICGHLSLCYLRPPFGEIEKSRGFSTLSIYELWRQLCSKNSFVPFPGSVPRHNPVWALQAVPFSSWLVFCSDMQCQLWDLIQTAACLSKPQKGGGFTFLVLTALRDIEYRSWMQRIILA